MLFQFFCLFCRFASPFFDKGLFGRFAFPFSDKIHRDDQMNLFCVQLFRGLELKVKIRDVNFRSVIVSGRKRNWKGYQSGFFSPG